MGSPKALLDADGRSFLARILASLQEGGAAQLLVVVRDTENPIAREARNLGAEVVLNPDPSTGPISSIQAGIRALPEDAAGILLSPVDHPLFLPATVRTLIRTFRESGAPLVIPAYEGWRGHPVLFAKRLFPELLGEDLTEGARTVVRRYLEERVQLPVDDPGILTDIDTPNEYGKFFS